MRAVFAYQVLRLLRDKVLLVWTLGLPIVLSLMFMAMFSGLERAYETTPMSFGVVRDEAYRSAPGLDALVERVSPASSPRSPTPPRPRPRPPRSGATPRATSPSRTAAPCCT